MTDKVKPADAPQRNFYGRRIGKKLNKSQYHHLETTLPKVSVDLSDPLAGNVSWLEIGFGGGEHLLHMAETYPERTIIGCEAFIDGVAKLVSRVGERGITNIKIHNGDARDLLDVLPSASIEKVFLLYPDPWPKKRHHRRRFMNPDNLDQLKRIIAPGGEFRIATDIDDYVRHSLEILENYPQFGRIDHSQTAAWPDWITTRYEAKAFREGRKPNYLTFERLAQ